MNEYTIKTPLGIFKDINDAIDCYPSLKEHKNIRECGHCHRYFIKIGKENAARKYCSEECSKEANSIKTKENYYNKVFTGQNRFSPTHYSQQLKDAENRNFEKDLTKQFIQDDTYWGLGESGLSGHIANDEDREQKYIRNEKKRLLGRV
jgi:hypothetical protein